MSFDSLQAFLEHHLALLDYSDPGLIEYCLGILEEDSLETQDKQDAILGILEIEEDDRELQFDRSGIEI